MPEPDSPIVIVRRTLQRLEKMSSEAIYQVMLTAGIQGTRCNTARCPVAIYLQRLSGTMVLVGSDGVRVKMQSKRQQDRSFSHLMRVPLSVQKFIYKFDNQQYPVLEGRAAVKRKEGSDAAD